MMSELELSPQEDGYYKKYDPYVDATVSNNFASSAFRFAHTLLPVSSKTLHSTNSYKRVILFISGWYI